MRESEQVERESDRPSAAAEQQNAVQAARRNAAQPTPTQAPSPAGDQSK